MVAPPYPERSYRVVTIAAPGNMLSREEISGGVAHLAMHSIWPSAMTAAHVVVDILETADKLKG
ncbi:hypothetical protein [Sediminicoccus sp. KRV36]|uniref:hypothetical protein n=1 Tax=Sediminicoccus sp. KRV36 TaxID=3133721 RepID=UPI00200D6951|nr:hypothetical protein [Sediminicoccus rosea]UPY38911.1 hypothetical protein LHU95_09500 [Sediminicoccus rosea]